MLSASLLTTLILALSITASPIEVHNSFITLPIARRLNTFNSTINISQQDNARVEALTARFASPLDRRNFNKPILNQGIAYTVTVGVGSPDTNCKFNLKRQIAAANGLSYTDQLLVDTGTSNTWVGGGTQPYVQTSTSVDLNEPLRITYGSNVMTGEEFSDTVTFGNNFRITEQSIGRASSSFDLEGADGILGLGPVALTQTTLRNHPTMTIPTVTQNLYTQGTISQELFSLSFEPISSDDLIYGELTFGTTDSTRYISSIAWT